MSTQTIGERLAQSLRPLTLGTSVLGRDQDAGLDLAKALLSVPSAGIDTSNAYMSGRSEALLGEAAQLMGGFPDGVAIFSKADQDPTTGAFDGDRVRRSLAETLGRLGVDHLPLYHLHDPDDIPLSEAMGKGGAVEALLELREEGVVGAIGIAAGTRAMMEAYVETDAFDAVLNHNRWTLLDRSADRLWDLATERRMAVFNAAPFGGGILAGSSLSANSYAYLPASSELKTFILRLRKIADESGIPLPAAALQFSMTDERIHSVVVGVSSVKRLAALDGFLNVEIPAHFWEQVAALGPPQKPRPPKNRLDRVNWRGA